MVNVDDYIITSISKIKQLENDRRMNEQREKVKRKKKEARRHFDFGRLVCKYFPDEDILAFENVLQALVANEELYSQLKEKAAKHALKN